MTETIRPQPAPRRVSRVPGPRGLPLVGVLPQLLRDPLGFLSAAAQRYDGFLRLDLGHIQLDPEPGRPAAPRVATTLRPHPGVWLRLRRRPAR